MGGTSLRQRRAWRDGADGTTFVQRWSWCVGVQPSGCSRAGLKPELQQTGGTTFAQRWSWQCGDLNSPTGATGSASAFRNAPRDRRTERVARPFAQRRAWATPHRPTQGSTASQKLWAARTRKLKLDVEASCGVVPDSDAHDRFPDAAHTGCSNLCYPATPACDHGPRDHPHHGHGRRRGACSCGDLAASAPGRRPSVPANRAGLLPS